MIEQVLQEIGLTQTEIKAYMALLELGESKSGQILQKSGLNSGKIYEILDSLQKKGLVSSITKSGVKHFSPADPKRVLEYLAEKKQEIEQQEKDYTQILPELIQKLSFVKTRPSIEIFTGLKGMKTAYAKELVFPKTENLYVLGIASSKQYPKKAWDFFIHNHQPSRERIGYKIKKLLNQQARQEDRFHEKTAELKYLPYGSMVSINVIGSLSTISIFTQELIFISIESQEVADNFKNQFELLWKMAKS